MTIENLIRRMPELHMKAIGTVAHNNEIIEGREGKVRYMVTKEELSEAQLKVFAVSASGPIEERLKFINNLTAKFGGPLSVEELPYLPGIHFALWDLGTVEKKIAKMKKRHKKS